MESTASSIRTALVELQYMARTAGIIEPDEHLEHIRGSRSYGQPPEINVRGPRGPRPLSIMPDFVHTTREREVLYSLQAAAATLRVLAAGARLAG